MGGAQTFGTALANLDKFAYIGGFSGQWWTRRIRSQTSSGGCSRRRGVQQEGEGAVPGIGSWKAGRKRCDQLTKAGINNVYYESPGTAHEWLTWRRCFKEFAPRLFR